MRIRPEVIWPSPSIMRSLVLAVAKVIKWFRHPVFGPTHIRNRHLILDTVVFIETSLLLELPWRQALVGPLPSLRNVTHESTLIAAKRDEDVGAFAGQRILETTHCTWPLAIVWSRPVLIWLEVSKFPATLPPPSEELIVRGERKLCWRVSVVANVEKGQSSYGVAVPRILSLLGKSAERQAHFGTIRRPGTRVEKMKTLK